MTVTRMHLGLIATPDSPHTQKWVRGLQRAGARVTVFSYAAADGGVPHVQVPPPPRAGRRLRYGWYTAGGPALRGALNAHGVDVACAHSLTPYGAWAARAGGRPLVSLAYGSEVFTLAPRLSRTLLRRHHGGAAGRTALLRSLALILRRPFFRREVRRALDASAFVVGSNHVLLDALADWFDVEPDRLRLNRWGVDPALFDVGDAARAALRRRMGLPAGRPVVLSPRGVRPLYQADVVLDAWERLLDGGADATFVLMTAGQTPPSDVHARATRIASHDDRLVYWTERLPRPEMHALWTLADVFVSAPVYDALSSVLYEGGYAGAVPVVNATDATAEVFAHGETAWIVEPFTAAGLAGALGEVLRDLDRLRPAVAAANRRWIEREALFPANVAAFLADCEAALLRAER